MIFNRILTRRLSSVALLGCLFSTGSTSARATILALDWSHLSAAYQAGAANATTTQNFTVGANTVSTVFAVQGGPTAANTFVLGTPTVATNSGTTSPTNQYATGGLTDGQLALQIGITLPDSAADSIKFTINFSQAVYGATFQLFDVDYGASFTDQLRNVFGVSGATTVLPTLTSSSSNTVGSAANNSADGFLNSVTGTAGSAQTAAAGNVTVTFANNVPVTSISFIYGDNFNANLGTVAPTNVAQQVVALSNIQWSTVSGVSVPEPGALAAICLGAAAVSAVVLRRPRQG